MIMLDTTPVTATIRRLISTGTPERPLLATDPCAAIAGVASVAFVSSSASSLILEVSTMYTVTSGSGPLAGEQIVDVRNSPHSPGQLLTHNGHHPGGPIAMQQSRDGVYHPGFCSNGRSLHLAIVPAVVIASCSMIDRSQPD
jgi:hypothetical protein